MYTNDRTYSHVQGWRSAEGCQRMAHQLTEAPKPIMETTRTHMMQGQHDARDIWGAKCEVESMSNVKTLRIQQLNDRDGPYDSTNRSDILNLEDIRTVKVRRPLLRSAV